MASPGGEGVRLGIVGETGQLAQAAAALARRRGWPTLCLSRESLPLERPADPPESLARFSPTHLLVAAAFTDVDGAESSPGRALAVNALSVGHLAAWCGPRGVRLVYPSSDYVFPGKEEGSYRPGEAPAPLSRYGESKAQGEREALSCPGALVARTAWLYGLGKGHFVEKIRVAARAGRPLAVVDDQIGSPTWVVAFASTLLDLVSARVEGVVHAACRGEASWRDLAVRALSVLGVEAEVGRLSTADLGRPARRPSRAVLTEDRWEAWGVPPPPTWEDALAAFAGLA